MTIMKVGVIIFVSGFSVSMVGLLVMLVAKMLEEML